MRFFMIALMLAAVTGWAQNLDDQLDINITALKMSKSKTPNSAPAMALGAVVSDHTNCSPYFVLEQYSHACATGSVDCLTGGGGLLWGSCRGSSARVQRGLNRHSEDGP